MKIYYTTCDKNVYSISKNIIQRMRNYQTIYDTFYPKYDYKLDNV